MRMFCGFLVLLCFALIRPPGDSAGNGRRLAALPDGTEIGNGHKLAVLPDGTEIGNGHKLVAAPGTEIGNG